MKRFSCKRRGRGAGDRKGRSRYPRSLAPLGGGWRQRVAHLDAERRAYLDRQDRSSGAVDEKSDFLTTLSVMSSTSDTTTTEVKPLDIVLVLDASGSMDDPMGGHDRTKRITALKGAAGDFIDTIVEQNEGLPAERQHKVAIVKFAGKKSSSVGNGTYRSNGYTYNYSQVMKGLYALRYGWGDKPQGHR